MKSFKKDIKLSKLALKNKIKNNKQLAGTLYKNNKSAFIIHSVKGTLNCFKFSPSKKKICFNFSISMSLRYKAFRFGQ